MIEDFNEDGWMDLFIAGMEQYDLMYINRGTDGTGWLGLSDVTDLWLPEIAAENGCAFAGYGDVDQDGDGDLMRGNLTGLQPPDLYLSNDIWLNTIPTPTPCGGRVPLFVHTTSDAWIEQTRSANTEGTVYSPWSDENGVIYDNQNDPIDWNCMSGWPGYHDKDFSLYVCRYQDATHSSQTGDVIKLTYQDTEGGDDKVASIYLPDGAECVQHENIHGEVWLYVDSKGNTYWDEDLCDTAYENFTPTPTPTPATPTPTPTPILI